jgi:hypothetical protein
LARNKGKGDTNKKLQMAKRPSVKRKEIIKINKNKMLN